MIEMVLTAVSVFAGIGLGLFVLFFDDLDGDWHYRQKHGQN